MENRELGIRPWMMVLFAALLAGGCMAPAELQWLSDACPAPACDPGQVQITEAVVYARNGGQTQMLDLYRPRNARGPLPAVVCIHGGGWRYGNRSDGYIREAAVVLASHGYVAAAPDYRLAPDHPFPAAVVDARECVRWLRRHADRQTIDPRRIGAVGMSAGGHLTLMLALASDTDTFGRQDEQAGHESARVQAAVNFFGPTDMGAADLPLVTVHQYVRPFLQGSPAERPENYRQASPITYVSADDPPVLTFQGSADPLVPASQATRLHTALSGAGVSNQLIILTGQGHGFVGALGRQTLRAMVAFFDKHLEPAGPRIEFIGEPTTRRGP